MLRKQPSILILNFKLFKPNNQGNGFNDWKMFHISRSAVSTVRSPTVWSRCWWRWATLVTRWARWGQWLRQWRVWWLTMMMLMTMTMCPSAPVWGHPWGQCPAPAPITPAGPSPRWSSDTDNTRAAPRSVSWTPVLWLPGEINNFLRRSDMI